MNPLLDLDAGLVAWLNQALGRSPALDYLVYLLVSDYFVPVAMSLWLLGLWLSGASQEERERRQRGVLRAALALGFAALLVVICNHFYFRERPFVHQAVTNLLYQPTDSSFPANPAAVSLALAIGVWRAHRRSGLALLTLAFLWVLTRVMNGVYYPSDVLAGAGMGVVATIAAGLVLRVMEPIPTWLLRWARYWHLA
ncbi:MAG: phosphatase PAP2 family protein [Dehalococcoidia bacterium]|nr:phosphatase PAP2 family protein [Dehalococcoidia bacterium]MSQ17676.1 phosphatase PAP2 family protein [Dehalococcoidia bacterium]